MQGLLDFIKTPEGQGLLSAAFGGLAGARRGQPLNSLGRAGLAGLQGYGGALDRQSQEGQLAQAKELRDMQLAQMRQAQTDKEAQRSWLDSQNPQMLANASKMPAVTPQNQMLWEAARTGAVPISDYVNSFKPKEPKYQTVEGNLVRIDGETPTLAFSAPAKPESAPSSVREFQYAVQNGYKGTYDQFKTLGPTITAAAMAGLRDAQIGNMTVQNAYNLPSPLPQRSTVGGAVSVRAPDGQIFVFPNQQAANQFKQQAGIN